MQLFKGKVHRFKRCPQNVYGVDFLDFYFCDCKGQRFFFNGWSQFFALRCRQLLRIIEEWMTEFFWQDDGCSKDRPRIASASCLVTSCFDKSFMIIRLEHSLRQK